jgi:acyl-CoA reductase LuxC
MNAPGIEAEVDVRSAVSDERWAVEAFVAELPLEGMPGGPFGDDAFEFCGRLSARLLAGGREAHPAVVSLGYWLRPASLSRMRDSLASAERPGVIIVPRGRVFHITPANVDTMFAYSWVLAMLAGNVNIVRLSSHRTEIGQRVLDAVAVTLADEHFRALRERNRLVTTSHDDRVSEALSAIADVRVIWGGDLTVEHFRRFPMPPRGRDVTFPNRHSFALIDSAAVATAPDSEVARLADRFFNDAYWFDQGACSSPRLVVWRASDAATNRVARQRLRAALADAIEARGYETETGMAIAKMVFAYRRAAVIEGLGYDRVSNETTWLELPSLTSYSREHCGGGLFFDYLSNDIAEDLGRLVGAADQTVACFGIDRDTAVDLARKLNGRGIDRWVAIGQALEFDAIWDGYDLLQEYVKRVVIDLPAGRQAAP